MALNELIFIIWTYACTTFGVIFGSAITYFYLKFKKQINNLCKIK
jgi:hypothetical protein